MRYRMKSVGRNSSKGFISRRSLRAALEGKSKEQKRRANLPHKQARDDQANLIILAQGLTFTFKYEPE